MHTTSAILLLFLNIFSVAAQDSLAIKQVRAETTRLLGRMNDLEAKQAHEGEVQAQTDQALFKQNRLKANAVLNTLEAVESCNGILQQGLVNAENQRIIADISNPQSGALGFRLDDALKKNLEDLLKSNSTIKNENKNALLTGLNTILGTAGQLLSPASLVVQTVQTIATLIPSKAKDASGQALASQLVDSMKPYLDYYGDLQKESDEYGAALSRLKTKYSSLTFDLRDLTAEAALHHVLATQSTSTNLDELFPTPTGANFDYASVNAKPDVQYITGISADVYALTKQVLEFHREYDAILRTHLRATKNLLDIAKQKFPGHDAAIEATKARIAIDVDITGLSRLLSTINNNLSGLRTYRTGTTAIIIPPAKNNSRP